MTYLIKYELNDQGGPEHVEMFLTEAGQPIEFSTEEEAKKCVEDLVVWLAAGSGGWPFTELVEQFGNEAPDIVEMWVVHYVDVEGTNRKV